MLQGAANPAAFCFTGISGASFLPSDLEGSTPPLDGTPGYFLDLNGSSRERDTTSATSSTSGLPRGVSASFSPNPVVSSNSSALNISANKSAPRGTYNLTITGSNGSYTQSTALTLTIN
jgi:hypothetical protein